jgi:hypothetical protein
MLSFVLTPGPAVRSWMCAPQIITKCSTLPRETSPPPSIASQHRTIARCRRPLLRAYPYETATEVRSHIAESPRTASIRDCRPDSIIAAPMLESEPAEAAFLEHST